MQDRSAEESFFTLWNSNYWHEASRAYMNSAVIFYRHHMFTDYQLVADMALDAMLKAMYIHNQSIRSAPALDTESWLSYAQLVTEINAGIVLLRVQYDVGHRHFSSRKRRSADTWSG